MGMLGMERMAIGTILIEHEIFRACCRSPDDHLIVLLFMAYSPVHSIYLS